MHCVCAILSYVAKRALQYFSTLSHERHDFRKQLLNRKCVLILSTPFVWNIFHSRKKCARYYHKRIIVFMWSTRHSRQILIKFEFSTQTFEKHPTQISNVTKIRPVGAELFHAHWHTDGRTDTVAFRNLCNASKNVPPYFLQSLLTIVKYTARYSKWSLPFGLSDWILYRPTFPTSSSCMWRSYYLVKSRYCSAADHFLM
jgi:hypothetical protein